MKLGSLDYIVVLSAVVVLFSSIFNQGFAIQMEAGISPAKNAADVAFTGDRIITLKYPTNSTFAQQLDGNKVSVAFTIDSSDSNNGLGAILEKINDQLLSEKQSLVKFENATLDYRATLNGGPTSATISYQVKLRPAITNLVTESNGSSSAVLDIDWRSIVLEKPLVVNTPEYGQIDVNLPIGGLEKLAPEVAAKVQNTTLAPAFEKPILDFEEFGVSMNNWHFLFDATGAQAGAAGYGFSVIEDGSKIVSIYSLGESSFREGTHTVKETSASADIDGVTITANDLTAPPSGQLIVDGYAQIQDNNFMDIEYLFVTDTIPNIFDPKQSTDGSWRTFVDSSTGLSLQYPSGSVVTNYSNTAIIDLNTLGEISIRINTYDKNFVSSLKNNLSIDIPWSDIMDNEIIKKFAKFSIDTAFNNSGALLTDDIRSDRDLVDDKNITSYVISNVIPDGSYIRSEHVLFANSEMNKLIDISITPPISDQMTPETKAIIKKIIESIGF